MNSLLAWRLKTMPMHKQPCVCTCQIAHGHLHRVPSFARASPRGDCYVLRLRLYFSPISAPGAGGRQRHVQRPHDVHDQRRGVLGRDCRLLRRAGQLPVLQWGQRGCDRPSNQNSSSQIPVCEGWQLVSSCMSPACGTGDCSHCSLGSELILSSGHALVLNAEPGF